MHLDFAIGQCGRVAARLACLLVAVFALCGSLNGQQAGAQEYREIRDYQRADGTTAPIDAAALDRKRLSIQQMLRDGQFGGAENEQLFDEFFHYRIAQFTWNESRNQLPDLRDSLKKRDLKTATGEVRNRLNQLVLDKSMAIVRSDEFAPLVRYNLMLLVSLLDTTEPDFSGQGAVPFPASTTALIDALADSKLPAPVRIAALAGLTRQTDFDLPADVRRTLTQRLSGFANAAEPPAGLDAVAHQWIARRSAQVLGKMAAKWPEANTAEVAKGLGVLVANEQMSLTARCDAAYALGALQVSAYSGVPVRDIAASVADLLVDVSQASYGSADPLKYYLWCVHFSMAGISSGRGIRAAAEGPAAEFVSQLMPKITELMDMVNNTRIKDAELIPQVAAKGQELQEWLKGQGTAAAALPGGATR